MAHAGIREDYAAPGFKLFGTEIVMGISLIGEDKKGVKRDDDDDDASEKKREGEVLPCPRCKSKETRFCYFNNYNINQPRHFCKGCQRYWTAGGALRNVPVGAGRRKARSSPHDGCILEYSPSCLERLVGEQWFSK